MHALVRRGIPASCSGAHSCIAPGAVCQIPMKHWDARAHMSLTTPTVLPGDVIGDVMSQVLEFAPNGFALTSAPSKG
jgi:hypothetical protein